MRHRRRAKYFGVKTAHRKAMFRNMATSLFRHGRITTTVTRAKELRRVADKLISLAKEGSLHSRRQALSFIMDKSVVAKLFSEIGPQMAERRGGYTRIVRIGPRRGDGAMMCVIELVKESLKTSKPKGKKTSESAESVAPVVIPEATQKEKDEESSQAAEAEEKDSVQEEESVEVSTEEGKAESEEVTSESAAEEEPQAPSEASAEETSGDETKADEETASAEAEDTEKAEAPEEEKGADEKKE